MINASARISRGWLLWSAALLLSAPAVAQDAGSRFSAAANLALGWEDNIALTADEQDKIDVATTEVAVDLAFRLAETRMVRLEGSLTPFYEWVSDVEDLSNYGGTVGLELVGGFGSGLTAPWYSARAGYTLIRFQDSDPRDGDWLDLELALGKRFTPRFGLHGGYRYHQRWQQDDDPICVTGGCAPRFGWQTDEVFDLERHGAFVHADLLPFASTTVFVEYAFWDGDVAVAGRPAVPGVAVVDDLALEGYDGNPGVFRVWRSDARQHVIEIGTRRRLTDRLSAELTAFYLWTSDVNNEISEDDYENTVVRLGFTFDI